MQGGDLGKSVSSTQEQDTKGRVRDSIPGHAAISVTTGSVYLHTCASTPVTTGSTHLHMPASTPARKKQLSAVPRVEGRSGQRIKNRNCQWEALKPANTLKFARNAGGTD